MNKNTTIIVAVVLIIIAAAGGFYAGMKYQTGRVTSGFAGRSGNFAQRFGGVNGQNANLKSVRGQVLSLGSNTMTVKMPDGSTAIVVLSTSTTYAQSQKASLSDIKTGDTVNVVGTSNSDGSVTAQDIQINPPSAGLFRGGNGQPPASPTGAGY